MDNHENPSPSTGQEQISSLSSQLSDAENTIAGMLSLSSGITLLASKAKEAVSELKDIDTLLTQISADNEKLSKSDLERIGNSAFTAAEKYGKAASDYLTAVREALSAGYKDAEGIAELSLALQASAGISAELAGQYISAVDSAYSLGGSAEKLAGILDGCTAIASKSTLGMTELAESMAAAGTQAESLGLGINETAAILAVMLENTGESAPGIAEAFKNILLNIRQVTDEDAGISPQGLAAYERACSALNVSLKETRDGITSLRDPMEVINDLSKAYLALDAGDSRKQSLLDAAGGGTGAEALDALLTNYGMYEHMLKEYDNSAGSMAAKAEALSQSWEGALNRLSETWTETVGSIAESDDVTAVINSLNNLLNIVNSLTTTLGSFNTIAAISGGIAGAKDLGQQKTILRRLCEAQYIPHAGVGIPG